MARGKSVSDKEAQEASELDDAELSEVDESEVADEDQAAVEVDEEFSKAKKSTRARTKESLDPTQIYLREIGFSPLLSHGTNILRFAQGAMNGSHPLVSIYFAALVDVRADLSFGKQVTVQAGTSFEDLCVGFIPVPRF